MTWLLLYNCSSIYAVLFLRFKNAIRRLRPNWAPATPFQWSKWKLDFKIKQVARLWSLSTNRKAMILWFPESKVPVAYPHVWKASSPRYKKKIKGTRPSIPNRLYYKQVGIPISGVGYPNAFFSSNRNQKTELYIKYDFWQNSILFLNKQIKIYIFKSSK